MAEIATVCPYCGCGCGVYLHVRDGRVVGVSPSRMHPVSQGGICIRGWHAHELVDNPSRLTRPLVRRGGELVEASWDDALAAVAQGLTDVIDSAGPEVVGVLGSARCTNEDNYVLARFARCTLQTPNIDCSLRIQCYPELSEAESCPGLGASTGQIADIDESDLIFLVGGDPTEEHPAVAARVYRARQRGARVITVSARRHPLARLADVHLPVRPGTEVLWAGSLLHVLLIDQGMARQAAGKLADLRASVADLTPEETQAATGVPPELLRRAAELYLASEQVAVIHSSGLALSAQGGAALQALSNLAALDPSAGGPRVVLLGLLSRNNLQGCRDMGVAPHLLPGYVHLTDEAGVQRFEQAWECSLARETGLSAWQMLGRVQAMYVMGDDIIRSMPDAGAARAALEGLRFLVVQDIFMSPVASLAHVVLPAAAFAERNGTWTSLERRVQHIRRVTEPPGEAREDWRIVADVSRAMGRPFPYEETEQIFGEIAHLLPIYAGLFYPPLAVNGGIRWPTPEAREAVSPVNVGGESAADRPTAQPIAVPDPPADTSEEYPLLLAPDPTLQPWDGETTVTHLLTVAGEFTVAEKDSPGGTLLLNPEDAKRCGVRGGRPARVRSAKGEAQVQVSVTDDVPEGIAIMPYGPATRSGLLEVSIDSDSGRPMLVPTPVTVSPAQ